LIERISVLIGEHSSQSIPEQFTKKYQASQTIALYERAFRTHRAVQN